MPDEELICPGSVRSTYRVLFVCRGNICRSPYAAAVAAVRGVDGISFSSAGTQAIVGRGLDEPMAAELHRRGIMSMHRARQVTRQIAGEADLIIAMGSAHREWILEEWPSSGLRTFVIGQVARELKNLPDGIGLEDVVPFLRRHRTVSEDDGVNDPYGRGPKAAADAAQIIDTRVETIVTALAQIASTAYYE